MVLPAYVTALLSCLAILGTGTSLSPPTRGFRASKDHGVSESPANGHEERSSSQDILPSEDLHGEPSAQRVGEWPKLDTPGSDLGHSPAKADQPDSFHWLTAALFELPLLSYFKKNATSKADPEPDTASGQKVRQNTPEPRESINTVLIKNSTNAPVYRNKTSSRLKLIQNNSQKNCSKLTDSSDPIDKDGLTKNHRCSRSIADATGEYMTQSFDSQNGSLFSVNSTLIELTKSETKTRSLIARDRTKDGESKGTIIDNTYPKRTLIQDYYLNRKHSAGGNNNFSLEPSEEAGRTQTYSEEGRRKEDSYEVTDLNTKGKEDKQRLGVEGESLGKHFNAGKRVNNKPFGSLSSSGKENNSQTSVIFIETDPFEKKTVSPDKLVSSLLTSFLQDDTKGTPAPSLSGMGESTGQYPKDNTFNRRKGSPESIPKTNDLSNKHEDDYLHTPHTSYNPHTKILIVDRQEILPDIGSIKFSDRQGVLDRTEPSLIHKSHINNRLRDGEENYRLLGNPSLGDRVRSGSLGKKNSDHWDSPSGITSGNNRDYEFNFGGEKSPNNERGSFSIDRKLSGGKDENNLDKQSSIFDFAHSVKKGQDNLEPSIGTVHDSKASDIRPYEMEFAEKIGSKPLKDVIVIYRHRIWANATPEYDNSEDESTEGYLESGPVFEKWNHQDDASSYGYDHRIEQGKANIGEWWKLLKTTETSGINDVGFHKYHNRAENVKHGYWQWVPKHHYFSLPSNNDPSLSNDQKSKGQGQKLDLPWASRDQDSTKRLHFIGHNYWSDIGRIGDWKKVSTKHSFNANNDKDKANIWKWWSLFKSPNGSSTSRSSDGDWKWVHEDRGTTQDEEYDNLYEDYDRNDKAKSDNLKWKATKKSSNLDHKYTGSKWKWWMLFKIPKERGISQGRSSEDNQQKGKGDGGHWEWVRKDRVPDQYDDYDHHYDDYDWKRETGKEFSKVNDITKEKTSGSKWNWWTLFKSPEESATSQGRSLECDKQKDELTQEYGKWMKKDQIPSQYKEYDHHYDDHDWNNEVKSGDFKGNVAKESSNVDLKTYHKYSGSNWNWWTLFKNPKESSTSQGRFLRGDKQKDEGKGGYWKWMQKDRGTSQYEEYDNHYDDHDRKDNSKRGDFKWKGAKDSSNVDNNLYHNNSGSKWKWWTLFKSRNESGTSQGRSSEDIQQKGKVNDGHWEWVHKDGGPAQNDEYDHHYDDYDWNDEGSSRGWKWGAGKESSKVDDDMRQNIRGSNWKWWTLFKSPKESYTSRDRSVEGDKKKDEGNNRDEEWMHKNRGTSRYEEYDNHYVDDDWKDNSNSGDLKWKEAKDSSNVDHNLDHYNSGSKWKWWTLFKNHNESGTSQGRSSEDNLQKGTVDYGHWEWVHKDRGPAKYDEYDQHYDDNEWNNEGSSRGWKWGAGKQSAKVDDDMKGIYSGSKWNWWTSFNSPRGRDISQGQFLEDDKQKDEGKSGYWKWMQKDRGTSRYEEYDNHYDDDDWKDNSKSGDIKWKESKDSSNDDHNLDHNNSGSKWKWWTLFKSRNESGTSQGRSSEDNQQKGKVNDGHGESVYKDLTSSQYEEYHHHYDDYDWNDKVKSSHLKWKVAKESSNVVHNTDENCRGSKWKGWTLFNSPKERATSQGRSSEGDKKKDEKNYGNWEWMKKNRGTSEHEEYVHHYDNYAWNDKVKSDASQGWTGKYSSQDHYHTDYTMSGGHGTRGTSFESPKDSGTNQGRSSEDDKQNGKLNGGHWEWVSRGPVQYDDYHHHYDDYDRNNNAKSSHPKWKATKESSNVVHNKEEKFSGSKWKWWYLFKSPVESGTSQERSSEDNQQKGKGDDSHWEWVRKDRGPAQYDEYDHHYNDYDWNDKAKSGDLEFKAAKESSNVDKKYRGNKWKWWTLFKSPKETLTSQGQSSEGDNYGDEKCMQKDRGTSQHEEYDHYYDDFDFNDGGKSDGFKGGTGNNYSQDHNRTDSSKRESHKTWFENDANLAQSSDGDKQKDEGKGGYWKWEKKDRGSSQYEDYDHHYVDYDKARNDDFKWNATKESSIVDHNSMDKYNGSKWEWWTLFNSPKERATSQARSSEGDKPTGKLNDGHWEWVRNDRGPVQHDDHHYDDYDWNDKAKSGDSKWKAAKESSNVDHNMEDKYSRSKWNWLTLFKSPKESGTSQARSSEGDKKKDEGTEGYWKWMQKDQTSSQYEEYDHHYDDYDWNDKAKTSHLKWKAAKESSNVDHNTDDKYSRSKWNWWKLLRSPNECGTSQVRSSEGDKEKDEGNYEDGKWMQKDRCTSQHEEYDHHYDNYDWNDNVKNGDWKWKTAKESSNVDHNTGDKYNGSKWKWWMLFKSPKDSVTSQARSSEDNQQKGKVDDGHWEWVSKDRGPAQCDEYDHHYDDYDWNDEGSNRGWKWGTVKESSKVGDESEEKSSGGKLNWWTLFKSPKESGTSEGDKEKDEGSDGYWKWMQKDQSPSQYDEYDHQYDDNWNDKSKTGDLEWKAAKKSSNVDHYTDDKYSGSKWNWWTMFRSPKDSGTSQARSLEGEKHNDEGRDGYWKWMQKDQGTSQYDGYDWNQMKSDDLKWNASKETSNVDHKTGDKYSGSIWKWWTLFKSPKERDDIQAQSSEGDIQKDKGSDGNWKWLHEDRGNSQHDHDDYDWNDKVNKSGFKEGTEEKKKYELMDGNWKWVPKHQSSPLSKEYIHYYSNDKGRNGDWNYGTVKDSSIPEDKTNGKNNASYWSWWKLLKNTKEDGASQTSSSGNDNENDGGSAGDWKWIPSNQVATKSKTNYHLHDDHDWNNEERSRDWNFGTNMDYSNVDYGGKDRKEGNNWHRWSSNKISKQTEARSSEGHIRKDEGDTGSWKWVPYDNDSTNYRSNNYDYDSNEKEKTRGWKSGTTEKSSNDIRNNKKNDSAQSSEAHFRKEEGSNGDWKWVPYDKGSSHSRNYEYAYDDYDWVDNERKVGRKSEAIEQWSNDGHDRDAKNNHRNWIWRPLSQTKKQTGVNQARSPEGHNRKDEGDTGSWKWVQYDNDSTNYRNNNYDYNSNEKEKTRGWKSGTTEKSSNDVRNNKKNGSNWNWWEFFKTSKQADANQAQSSEAHLKKEEGSDGDWKWVPYGKGSSHYRNNEYAYDDYDWVDNERKEGRKSEAIEQSSNDGHDRDAKNNGRNWIWRPLSQTKKQTGVNQARSPEGHNRKDERSDGDWKNISKDEGRSLSAENDHQNDDYDWNDTQSNGEWKWRNAEHNKNYESPANQHQSSDNHNLKNEGIGGGWKWTSSNQVPSQSEVYDDFDIHDKKRNEDRKYESGKNSFNVNQHWNDRNKDNKWSWWSLNKISKQTGANQARSSEGQHEGKDEESDGHWKWVPYEDDYSLFRNNVHDNYDWNDNGKKGSWKIQSTNEHYSNDEGNKNNVSNWIRWPFFKTSEQSNTNENKSSEGYMRRDEESSKDWKSLSKDKNSSLPEEYDHHYDWDDSDRKEGWKLGTTEHYSKENHNRDNNKNRSNWWTLFESPQESGENHAWSSEVHNRKDVDWKWMRSNQISSQTKPNNGLYGEYDSKERSGDWNYGTGKDSFHVDHSRKDGNKDSNWSWGSLYKGSKQTDANEPRSSEGDNRKGEGGNGDWMWFSNDEDSSHKNEHSYDDYDWNDNGRKRGWKLGTTVQSSNDDRNRDNRNNGTFWKWWTLFETPQNTHANQDRSSDVHKRKDEGSDKDWKWLTKNASSSISEEYPHHYDDYDWDEKEKKYWIDQDFNPEHKKNDKNKDGGWSWWTWFTKPKQSQAHRAWTSENLNRKGEGSDGEVESIWPIQDSSQSETHDHSYGDYDSKNNERIGDRNYEDGREPFNTDHTWKDKNKGTIWSRWSLNRNPNQDQDWKIFSKNQDSSHLSNNECDYDYYDWDDKEKSRGNTNQLHKQGFSTSGEDSSYSHGHIDGRQDGDILNGPNNLPQWKDSIHLTKSGVSTSMNSQKGVGDHEIETEEISQYGTKISINDDRIIHSGDKNEKGEASNQQNHRLNTKWVNNFEPTTSAYTTLTNKGGLGEEYVVGNDDDELNGQGGSDSSEEYNNLSPAGTDEYRYGTRDNQLRPINKSLWTNSKTDHFTRAENSGTDDGSMYKVTKDSGVNSHTDETPQPKLNGSKSLKNVGISNSVSNPAHRNEFARVKKPLSGSKTHYEATADSDDYFDEENVEYDAHNTDEYYNDKQFLQKGAKYLKKPGVMNAETDNSHEIVSDREIERTDKPLDKSSIKNPSGADSEKAFKSGTQNMLTVVRNGTKLLSRDSSSDKYADKNRDNKDEEIKERYTKYNHGSNGHTLWDNSKRVRITGEAHSGPASFQRNDFVNKHGMEVGNIDEGSQKETSKSSIKHKNLSDGEKKDSNIKDKAISKNSKEFLNSGTRSPDIIDNDRNAYIDDHDLKSRSQSLGSSDHFNQIYKDDQSLGDGKNIDKPLNKCRHDSSSNKKSGTSTLGYEEGYHVNENSHQKTNIKSLKRIDNDFEMSDKTKARTLAAYDDYNYDYVDDHAEDEKVDKHFDNRFLKNVWSDSGLIKTPEGTTLNYGHENVEDKTVKGNVDRKVDMYWKRPQSIKNSGSTNLGNNNYNGLGGESAGGEKVNNRIIDESHKGIIGDPELFHKSWASSSDSYSHDYVDHVPVSNEKPIKKFWKGSKLSQITGELNSDDSKDFNLGYGDDFTAGGNDEELWKDNKFIHKSETPTTSMDDDEDNLRVQNNGERTIHKTLWNGSKLFHTVRGSTIFPHGLLKGNDLGKKPITKGKTTKMLWNSSKLLHTPDAPTTDAEAVSSHEFVNDHTSAKNIVKNKHALSLKTHWNVPKLHHTLRGSAVVPSATFTHRFVKNQSQANNTEGGNDLLKVLWNVSKLIHKPGTPISKNSAFYEEEELKNQPTLGNMDQESLNKPLNECWKGFKMHHMPGGLTSDVGKTFTHKNNNIGQGNTGGKTNVKPISTHLKGSKLLLRNGDSIDESAGFTQDSRNDQAEGDNTDGEPSHKSMKFLWGDSKPLKSYGSSADDIGSPKYPADINIADGKSSNKSIKTIWKMLWKGSKLFHKSQGHATHTGVKFNHEYVDDHPSTENISDTDSESLNKLWNIPKFHQKSPKIAIRPNTDATFAHVFVNNRTGQNVLDKNVLWKGLKLLNTSLMATIGTGRADTHEHSDNHLNTDNLDENNSGKSMHTRWDVLHHKFGHITHDEKNIHRNSQDTDKKSNEELFETLWTGSKLQIKSKEPMTNSGANFSHELLNDRAVDEVTHEETNGQSNKSVRNASRSLSEENVFSTNPTEVKITDGISTNKSIKTLWKVLWNGTKFHHTSGGQMTPSGTTLRHKYEQGHPVKHIVQQKISNEPIDSVVSNIHHKFSGSDFIGHVTHNKPMKFLFKGSKFVHKSGVPNSGADINHEYVDHSSIEDSEEKPYNYSWTSQWKGSKLHHESSLPSIDMGKKVTHRFVNDHFENEKIDEGSHVKPKMWWNISKFIHKLGDSGQTTTLHGAVISNSDGRNTDNEKHSDNDAATGGQLNHVLKSTKSQPLRGGTKILHKTVVSNSETGNTDNQMFFSNHEVVGDQSNQIFKSTKSPHFVSWTKRFNKNIISKTNSGIIDNHMNSNEYETLEGQEKRFFDLTKKPILHTSGSKILHKNSGITDTHLLSDSQAAIGSLDYQIIKSIKSHPLLGGSTVHTKTEVSNSDTGVTGNLGSNREPTGGRENEIIKSTQPHWGGKTLVHKTVASDSHTGNKDILIYTDNEAVEGNQGHKVVKSAKLQPLREGQKILHKSDVTNTHTGNKDVPMHTHNEAAEGVAVHQIIKSTKSQPLWGGSTILHKTVVTDSQTRNKDVQIHSGNHANIGGQENGVVKSTTTLPLWGGSSILHKTVDSNSEEGTTKNEATDGGQGPQIFKSTNAQPHWEGSRILHKSVVSNRHAVNTEQQFHSDNRGAIVGQDNQVNNANNAPPFWGGSAILPNIETSNSNTRTINNQFIKSPALPLWNGSTMVHKTVVSNTDTGITDDQMDSGNEATQAEQGHQAFKSTTTMGRPTTIHKTIISNSDGRNTYNQTARKVHEVVKSTRPFPLWGESTILHKNVVSNSHIGIAGTMMPTGNHGAIGDHVHEVVKSTKPFPVWGGSTILHKTVVSNPDTSIVGTKVHSGHHGVIGGLVQEAIKLIKPLPLWGGLTILRNKTEVSNSDTGITGTKMNTGNHGALGNHGHEIVKTTKSLPLSGGSGLLHKTVVSIPNTGVTGNQVYSGNHGIIGGQDHEVDKSSKPFPIWGGLTILHKTGESNTDTGVTGNQVHSGNHGTMEGQDHEVVKPTTPFPLWGGTATLHKTVESNPDIGVTGTQMDSGNLGGPVHEVLKSTKSLPHWGGSKILNILNLDTGITGNQIQHKTVLSNPGTVITGTQMIPSNQGALGGQSHEALKSTKSFSLSGGPTTLYKTLVSNPDTGITGSKLHTGNHGAIGGHVHNVLKTTKSLPLSGGLGLLHKTVVSNLDTGVTHNRVHSGNHGAMVGQRHEVVKSTKSLPLWGGSTILNKTVVSNLDTGITGSQILQKTVGLNPDSVITGTHKHSVNHGALGGQDHEVLKPTKSFPLSGGSTILHKTVVSNPDTGITGTLVHAGNSGIIAGQDSQVFKSTQTLPVSVGSVTLHKTIGTQMHSRNHGALGGQDHDVVKSTKPLPLFGGSTVVSSSDAGNLALPSVIPQIPVPGIAINTNSELHNIGVGNGINSQPFKKSPVTNPLTGADKRKKSGRKRPKKKKASSSKIKTGVAGIDATTGFELNNTVTGKRLNKLKHKQPKNRLTVTTPEKTMSSDLHKSRVQITNLLKSPPFIKSREVIHFNRTNSGLGINYNTQSTHLHELNHALTSKIPGIIVPPKVTTSNLDGIHKNSRKNRHKLKGPKTFKSSKAIIPDSGISSGMVLNNNMAVPPLHEFEYVVPSKIPEVILPPKVITSNLEGKRKNSRQNQLKLKDYKTSTSSRGIISDSGINSGLVLNQNAATPHSLKLNHVIPSKFQEVIVPTNVITNTLDGKPIKAYKNHPKSKNPKSLIFSKHIIPDRKISSGSILNSDLAVPPLLKLENLVPSKLPGVIVPTKVITSNLVGKRKNSRKNRPKLKDSKTFTTSKDITPDSGLGSGLVLNQNAATPHLLKLKHVVSSKKPEPIVPGKVTTSYLDGKHKNTRRNRLKLKDSKSTTLAKNIIPDTGISSGMVLNKNLVAPSLLKLKHVVPSKVPGVLVPAKVITSDLDGKRKKSRKNRLKSTKLLGGLIPENGLGLDLKQNVAPSLFQSSKHVIPSKISLHVEPEYGVTNVLGGKRKKSSKRILKSPPITSFTKSLNMIPDSIVSTSLDLNGNVAAPNLLNTNYAFPSKISNFITPGNVTSNKLEETSKKLRKNRMSLKKKKASRLSKDMIAHNGIVNTLGYAANPQLIKLKYVVPSKIAPVIVPGDLISSNLGGGKLKKSLKIVQKVKYTQPSTFSEHIIPDTGIRKDFVINHNLPTPNLLKLMHPVNAPGVITPGNVIDSNSDGKRKNLRKKSLKFKKTISFTPTKHISDSTISSGLVLNNNLAPPNLILKHVVTPKITKVLVPGNVIASDSGRKHTKLHKNRLKVKHSKSASLSKGEILDNTLSGDLVLKKIVVAPDLVKVKHVVPAKISESIVPVLGGKKSRRNRHSMSTINHINGVSSNLVLKKIVKAPQLVKLDPVIHSKISEVVLPEKIVVSDSGGTRQKSRKHIRKLKHVFPPSAFQNAITDSGVLGLKHNIAAPDLIGTKHILPSRISQIIVPSDGVTSVLKRKRKGSRKYLQKWEHPTTSIEPPNTIPDVAIGSGFDLKHNVATSHLLTMKPLLSPTVSDVIAPV